MIFPKFIFLLFLDVKLKVFMKIIFPGKTRYFNLKYRVFQTTKSSFSILIPTEVFNY